MKTTDDSIFLTIVKSKISAYFLRAEKLLTYKYFLEGTTNALGCMNVILLHSNRLHVLATHVVILRVGTIKMQIQL
jgi:hypothetical protein